MKGRDFVVLSDTLTGIPTSSFHLFKNIVKDNRVFWFNILTRMPSFSRTDFVKVKSAICSWTGKLNTCSDQSDPQGIQMFSPIMIPLFYSIFRQINRKLLSAQFTAVQNQWKIRDPIFVTTFPVVADFFQCFPFSSRIYYCVDDFLQYPGIHHRSWQKMEASLLNNIDGLIVTSKHLSYKCPSRLPLLHLPHGVDFYHFKRNNTKKPVFSQPLRHPVVGFFGLISEWVDLDLISYLSDCFPSISFLMIGRSDVSLNKIRNKHNITIVDYVSYNDLPEFASQFDIGLIPFCINDLTKAVNPLKLLEYYALGLPVVSSKLPELINFPGPIRLAETKDEFRIQLALTINEFAQSNPLDAELIAERNSWQSRVEDLYRFLDTIK